MAKTQKKPWMIKGTPETAGSGGLFVLLFGQTQEGSNRGGQESESGRAKSNGGRF
jgi:hypothetical protein